MKPLLPIIATIAACSLATADDNWPQWRGPNLNGSADAKNLPTTWSEAENIVWKVKLPWWSGSTPIIWGDKIFVMSPEPGAPEPATPQPRGQGERDPGGDKLMLLCLNRADGKEIWRREAGTGNALHRKGNETSPSPVTDGKNMWTLTGGGELVAFDFDGKEIWRRNVQKDYGKFGLNWGYGSSPLLLHDRLIVEVFHGNNTTDPCYLLALDKLTGKTLWKTNRPTDAVKESPDAYTTAMPLRYDGHVEIVSSGGDAVTGHDAASGKEIWRVDGFDPQHAPNNRSIASPLTVGDLVIAPSRRNPMLIIKAGGQGNVSKSHVLWQSDKGPDVPTPVSDGKHFWCVDDQGIATCYEARTGKITSEPRRVLRGPVSASLALADGKVYAINEWATCAVFSATPDFKLLATNQLDGEKVLSSPVVVGDRIYIRTEKHLYCIGKK